VVREQGTGNREEGIGKREEGRGKRFWAILLFVTYVGFFCLSTYSKFSLSEVHFVQARCPHHKSFIINICTS